ncbi:hypothetical protein C8N46_104112 [Kordia periserrulae]|uniref:Uncharacterized protein n=1 Tax=Kordia periserrulae TaxID=701523 RepID=A0A2T6BZH7_9FLAO|nr:hypothetical protein [Kordia periserrulae]PTX61469.1 hypothetical protein C8N46_104112 [Kordia periserrulae]
MNKYELKIVSVIDNSSIVLLQSFLYANNESTANIMADNIFNSYLDNSNCTEYYEGIIVQKQLNIIEN